MDKLTPGTLADVAVTADDAVMALMVSVENEDDMEVREEEEQLSVDHVSV